MNGTDPFSLILNATPIVQGVIALLLLASLLTWVAIFQRAIDLQRLGGHSDAFEAAFWSGQDLRALFGEIRRAGDASGLEALFESGFGEFLRHENDTDLDPDVRLQGIQRAMRVALAREEERMERFLPFLATVGSVSPYVGLFGTVWGIMNAFIGLGAVAQVTLQTIAPGIAEALIATAMGLLAAIPAVVAYNRFATRVDQLLKRHETFIDEFLAVLQRSILAQRRRPAQPAGGSAA